MQAILHAFRFFFTEIFWGVVYFIPWWYGTGRGKIQRALINQAKDLVRTLHLKTLARFLFQPMYGLTDIPSRIISVAVRIVHFTLLMILATIYLAGLLVFLLIWLLFPIFVAYNIAFHFGVIPFNIYTWLGL